MRAETVKDALQAFAEGFCSFVRFPFIRMGWNADTFEPPVPREPDISQYFGAVGKYLSDACDKFEETRK